VAMGPRVKREDGKRGAKVCIMRNQTPQEDLRRLWPIALAIALLVLAVFIFVPREPPGHGPVQISYTQFKTFLRDGHVEQISIRGDEIEGRLSTVVPGAERAAEQGSVATFPNSATRNCCR
jgi:hypothetical protein